MQQAFTIEKRDGNIYITFLENFDLHRLQNFEKEIKRYVLDSATVIDMRLIEQIDTATALFLSDLKDRYTLTLLTPSAIEQTFLLVKKYPKRYLPPKEKNSLLKHLGLKSCAKYRFVINFLAFIGELFVKIMTMLFQLKHFRYKEILFEINQCAIKALGIVGLTSFLVGVVVAYQSAMQLKLYGANIFIVDMLGISILRELAPMITAIVIAGRSGSAYTAEIGAMKITEELDAMRTMGFDPFYYLVIPRIIALIVSLPILIFVADAAGVFGGMIISSAQLDISFSLFVDRFQEVIALKHFIIGISKGPFFAYLIATISIYRGFMVKDDTQSIGKNTTKSVVESIFAVIVCDALFSVILTNLGV